MNKELQKLTVSLAQSLNNMILEKNNNLKGLRYGFKAAGTRHNKKIKIAFIGNNSDEGSDIISQQLKKDHRTLHSTRLEAPFFVLGVKEQDLNTLGINTKECRDSPFTNTAKSLYTLHLHLLLSMLPKLNCSALGKPNSNHRAQRLDCFVIKRSKIKDNHHGTDWIPMTAIKTPATGYPCGVQFLHRPQ